MHIQFVTYNVPSILCIEAFLSLALYNKIIPKYGFDLSQCSNILYSQNFGIYFDKGCIQPLLKTKEAGNYIKNNSVT